MTPVTVFSKPSCPQCNATYRGLGKKGIDYEVVDVSADEEAKAFILGLGYQSVPVVVVGEDHWYGYRPDKIAELARSLATAA